MFSRVEASETRAVESKLSSFFIAGVFFSCAFRDLRFVSFLAPQDLFLFAAFISLYLNYPPCRSKWKMNQVLLVGIFVCIVFTVFSFLVSRDPIESSFNYAKVFVAFIILPSTIWMFVYSFEDISFLIWSYLSGVLFACAITLFFHIGIDSGRASGLSGHAVFFGMLTSTGIVIALGQSYKNFRVQVLALSVVCLASFALAQSASSTGLVNIAVALLAILIMNIRQKRFLISIRFWILPVVFFIIAWNSGFLTTAKSRLLISFNPRAGYSSNSISGTSTIEARLYSVRFGWERIKDSLLFGHGLDTLGRSTSIGLEPHNFIVLAWQCGGVLLLFTALTFLFLSMKYFLIFIRKNYTLGVVVWLVTWLELMTEPLIYERSILTPFFLVCIASHIQSFKRD